MLRRGSRSIRSVWRRQEWTSCLAAGTMSSLVISSDHLVLLALRSVCRGIRDERGVAAITRLVTRYAIFGAAAAFLGCEGRRTVTGTAEPIGLTVRVNVGPALAPAAQALGWSGAAVPGATVVAQLTSDNLGQLAADTVVTDASGVSRFGNLLAGSYTFQVSRPLTADEQTRAGGALGSVYALAGVGTIVLTPSGADTLDVELNGVGAGTLAFSEIFQTEPLLTSIGEVYMWGAYLKIYNNADTTIQLAGKLFISAVPGNTLGGPFTCSSFAAIEHDGLGLWAQYIFRFPDTAQPLAPGTGALIATDAIDHTQIKNAAGFFDLSRAEFEFKGTQDAHNPLAQGMLDVGPQPFDGGHGWVSNGDRQVIALVEPLDLTLLVSHFDPVYGGGQIFLRIPTEALLDVVQWKPIFPPSPYLGTDCPSSVVASIDAAEARNVVTFYDTLTMHRRVSRTLTTGRVIIQQSHNSAADWYAAPGTPYKMP
jgi:hypothetical protein